MEQAAITLREAQSHEMETVRSIMTHPRVYRWITDDGSPPPEEFHPADHPAVIYVIAWQGDEPIGVCVLVHQNLVCYELHIALLPAGWGRAKDIVQLMLHLLWENTECQRVVASIPVTNRLAVRLARSVGALVFGYNPRSIQKDGRLIDQVLFGVSRPKGV